MILFLDLETTGLDPNKGVILEVAAILTDEWFVKLADFESVIKFDSNTNTQPVSPIIVAMHTTNGLWLDVFKAQEDISTVDLKMATWLADKARGQTVLLAGNSIHFDRSFMTVHMPITLALLHYRQIDITSINEMAKRCWTGAYETRPTPGKGHRAMADATESWKTAIHYECALMAVEAAAVVEPISAVEK